MSTPEKVVVVVAGPTSVAVIDEGLVHVGASGALEPNVAEIARRMGLWQQGIAEVGRVMLDVLTPTIERLSRLLADPQLRRLIRAAEKRERYNRKMAARARSRR